MPWFTLTVVALLLAAQMPPCAAEGAPSADNAASVRFDADRVIVELTLQDGNRLRLYTDTGGAGTILTDEAATKLRLVTAPIERRDADTMPPGSARLVAPLPLIENQLPPPPTPIMVFPDRGGHVAREMRSDGMLGQNWFAGRVWTWDYPKQTLTVERPAWRPVGNIASLPVTFRMPAAGQTRRFFPRIVATIAGEPTSMLLDTGATTTLDAAALQVIGPPAVRATSMITARRIARWRTLHPEWRIIERGQLGTGARMIEVPDVRIAGIQVGPVWFTERPDANFTEMMSSETDEPVEGAIGGNAFHSLRMTVDYIRGRAWFARGVAR